MWNAWTAPPGARPSDYDPWTCEAHCARCGELAQDCHCDEDDDMHRETYGQAVERQGLPEIFDWIIQLAQKHERIPVGFWDMTPKVGWRIVVNGTTDERNGVPPWHALIEHLGLPAALVSPAGGALIGHDEDDVIAMLREAVQEEPIS
jgi:hypothetical protein